jgi:hypothetical protein
VNPELDANEADLAEQAREVAEAEQAEVPRTIDVEADPVDRFEQSVPVPSEEEDYPDA